MGMEAWLSLRRRRSRGAAAVEVRERLLGFVDEVRVGAAACAAAGERGVVCAGPGRAGRSEELAADVVSVGGDGGAV